MDSFNSSVTNEDIILVLNAVTLWHLKNYNSNEVDFELENAHGLIRKLSNVL